MDMIKKSLVIGLTAVMLVGNVGYTGGYKNIVHAEEVVTSNEINNQYVDELDNYTINIPTDMKFAVRDYNNEEQMLTLTLSEPCSIMMSINHVNASYEIPQEGQESKKEPENLVFNMYSDSTKINQIKNMGSLGKNKEQTYLGPYYLDAGTYYISVEGERSSKGDASGTTTGQYCIGAVIERSASNEQFAPSTFNNPNVVEIGTEFNGFASEVHKVDYYTFTVNKDCLLNLDCLKQSGSGSVDVEIMDNKKVVSTYATLSNIDEKVLQTYLRKGQYYIRVTNKSNQSGSSSNAVGEGGKMKFIMTNMYYTLSYKLSKTKVTNQPITVTVNTNIEDAQVGIVKASKIEVTADNTESAWKRTDATSTNGILQNCIESNGSYYILVKDRLGNTIYKKITIKNIDTKKPAKPVVKSYKRNSKKVSGTAEKNSTVYVKVGYQTSMGYKEKTYKAKVSSKGKWTVKTMKLKKGYTLTVTAKDAAGNISSEKVVTVNK